MHYLKEVLWEKNIQEKQLTKESTKKQGAWINLSASKDPSQIPQCELWIGRVWIGRAKASTS